MNREERLAKYQAWEAAYIKRQEEKEYICREYKNLSYCDRLLFRTVIDFLRQNPSAEDLT